MCASSSTIVITGIKAWIVDVCWVAPGPLQPQDTSLGELRAGLANLRLELSERTGQLKALVKENFDRFISCKTCGLSRLALLM